jgi:hypothetical protein
MATPIEEEIANIPPATTFKHLVVDAGAIIKGERLESTAVV